MLANININPLASPCTRAPSLKYGDINNETPFPSRGQRVNKYFIFYNNNLNIFICYFI